MASVVTMVIMVFVMPVLKEVKFVSPYLRWIGHNSYVFYLFHPMLITLCGKLELPKGIRHIAIIIRISLIVYLK